MFHIWCILLTVDKNGRAIHDRFYGLIIFD